MRRSLQAPTCAGPARRSGRALFALLGVAFFAVLVLAFAGLLLDGGGDLLSLGPAERAPALQPGSPRNLTDGAAAPAVESTDTGRSEVAARAELASPEPAAALETIGWSGRVTSRITHEPLADARVVLHGGAGSTEAESDERGEFQLAWVGPATPALEVARAGFATLRRPVADLAQPGVFELEPAGELLVLVQGPSSEELSEGLASLWDLALDGGTRHAPLEARVDDQGAFRFGDLGAGEYSLGVRVPGWSLVYEHRVLVDAGQRVELVLEPARGATVRALVRWEQELTPVVGAEVRYVPEQQGASRAVENLGSLETLTDAEGRFELGGLSTGSGELTIETARGSRLVRDVFVGEPGKLYTLEFELPRPGSLAGHVVDARGQGVAGAEVGIVWRASSVQDVLAGRLDDATVCDANGRFLIEGIPARRRFALAASRGGGATPDVFGTQRVEPLASGEEREDFELRIDDTLTVPGVVRDERGAPVEAARVRASYVGGRRRVPWTKTTTDAEGRFELMGLLPGSYRVDVRDAGADGGDAAYLDSSQELELAEDAQPRPLEFELESAHGLAGLVVDAWGNAVPRARVRASFLPPAGESAPRDQRTRADEFGRFEFGRLAAGSYSLGASATGFRKAEKVETVEVPGGDALLVLERLPLVERALLYGRAIDGSGRAPIGLRLSDTRGGSLSLAGTEFRISGVRPGRVRLEFRAEGQIPLRLAPLDVLPGARLDLGELRFERAGQVKVFARKQGASAPLSGFKARLVALPLDEGGRGQGSLRLDRRREPRRWQDGGPRVTSEYGLSTRVPLARWKLVVERKGFKRATRTIELTPERSKRTFVIELEPRG